MDEVDSSARAQISESQAFQVVVIETPNQAQHSDEREAKSDQHEAEDLAAQQKAADAAERGATAAWLQALLATIGAIGLFWTIWLTRNSLRLTRESNEHSRSSAERELRAYVSVNPGDVRLVGEGKWIGHVEIANVGKVPASNVRINVNSLLTAVGVSEKFDQPDATVSIGVIQPSATIRQGSPTIDAGQPDDYVYIFGTVNYLDGFGHERWTRFCYRYSGKARQVGNAGSKDFRGIPAATAQQHPYGNDAT